MIKITAKTEKGKEVMQTQGQDSRAGRAALKVCGFKKKTISENPLIMELTLKRVPPPVFEQIIFALEKKFLDLGATKDTDYTMEVA